MEKFKLYYYSERGLINYFVEQIIQLNDNTQMEVIRNIVKNISFPFMDAEERKKLNNININNVKMLVEPSFGQYGDPDLIIRISPGQRGNDRKYKAIFIEAKRSKLSEALKQKNTSNILCQLINKMRIWESKVAFSKNKVKQIQYSGEKSVERILKNEESLNMLDLFLSKSEEISRCNIGKKTDIYYVALTSFGNIDHNTIKETTSILKSFLSAKEYKDSINLLDNKNRHIARLGSITYDDLASCFINNCTDIKRAYEEKLSYYKKKGKDINNERILKIRKRGRK